MESGKSGKEDHDISSSFARLKSQRGIAQSCTSMSIQFILLLLLSTATTTWGQTDPPTAAPLTVPPTNAPTRSPTLGLTIVPTVSPSFVPTRAPQITPFPTNVLTGTPTVGPSQGPSTTSSPSESARPSVLPTASSRPSAQPSVSLEPSAKPSASPTSSKQPSASPSALPTHVPSGAPSDIPSQIPSSSEAFVAQESYRLTLLFVERDDFNDTEVVLLELLLASYTDDFAPENVRTTTMCRVDGQNLFDCAINDPQCTFPALNASDPDSPQLFLNDVDFFCNWTSSVTDVTTYPERFATFASLNVDTVTDNLQALGLEVLRALPVRVRSIATLSPTLAPSGISSAPTRRQPTAAPSSNPTPVSRTTEMPSFGFPTFAPSLGPTSTPTMSPTQSDDDGLGVAALSGIVISFGLITVASLFLYYRKQKRKKQQSAKPSSAIAEEPTRTAKSSKTRAAPKKPILYDASSDSEAGVALISPSESLVSKQSLLSAGESALGDESDAEIDGTRNLQDEFDQYKDQNLEQLRSDVEGNLAGFEGIMSAAVTRALMGDDDQQQEITAEVTWGCAGTPAGAEVESSALCEVNDWLKRHEGASVEQKRLFMQDVLNRMVTSVRFGVVLAEDASRTIHESAALLSLPLANDLPMTTLIISGMRKKAAASHMVSVLREFGDIDVAAVASGQRGFGIVRFRHPKSVDRAMRRYRSGEIVIEDVGVQIKALMPSGNVEGRNR